MLVVSQHRISHNKGHNHLSRSDHEKGYVRILTYILVYVTWGLVVLKFIELYVGILTGILGG